MGTVVVTMPGPPKGWSPNPGGSGADNPRNETLDEALFEGLTKQQQRAVLKDIDHRFYTSERVYHEQIGTGDGKTTRFSGKVACTPVKPKDSFGQMGIEFVSRDTLYDLVGEDRDGSGVLRGDASAESSIDHDTGAFIIDFMTAPDKGMPIYANYWFSMEGGVASKGSDRFIPDYVATPDPQPDAGFTPDHVVKGGYFCQYCGTQYQEKDVECRKCGAPRSKEKAKACVSDGDRVECGTCGDILERPWDVCSCPYGPDVRIPQPAPEIVGSTRPLASRSIVHKGESGWGLGKTLFGAFTLVTGVVGLLSYVDTFLVPVI